MPRFVQFSKFGGPEVLEVIDLAEPAAGPGQVRVRVKAAGLNPVEYKIFHGGPAAAMFAVTPPCGVGNDFAGIVDQVGAGVTALGVGDAVLGGARNHALADYVVVPAEAVVRKPAALSFEVAGALEIAGRTAWASVASLGLTDADTVLISAAAGGVGNLAAQLAVRTGATVVGTASPANHDYLASLGVIPVVYGDGLADRLRAAAPDGFTAVLDNHGPDTVALGLALGVPANRINTIAAFGSPPGVTYVGMRDASLSDLAHLADLLAAGELTLPIEATYPLDQVVAAYRRLETGHLRGKIVLTTD
jgi:NADPH:quinone reductase-like Zn-dependent oxidoreductase